MTKEKKVSWVTQVRSLLADLLMSKVVDKLRIHKVPEEIDKATLKYKTIPISDLDLREVQRSLGLKPASNDDEFKHVLPITPPRTMREHLKLIETVSSHTPTTEPSARWIINALVPRALNIAAADGPPDQRINIQTDYSYTHGPVKLGRDKVLLSARPDYRIWYGDWEQLALNVVIVEAKRIDIGLSQALGYMGCIHREWKEFSKSNCTVYGFACNGTIFWFLKISNESKWSEYLVSVRTGDYSQPLGLMVHMFRRAIVMSPAHPKPFSTM
ncbi:uncharacterized protein N7506_002152 [Penicillium brevicompactum]|uniref:uncharacterized protein n=1 Tax=Penicillium brevicompactum TaxID=5074 RepID=UPI00254182FF|nr:uncharacterized protein N7506_002152 [Penicillium brevicompactum]KAJ5348899.1 hypothetical protein N7506_002152 [Penicillium brevicompactum]